MPKKTLGPVSLCTALGIGAIIGAGIYRDLHGHRRSEVQHTSILNAPARLHDLPQCHAGQAGCGTGFLWLCLLVLVAIVGRIYHCPLLRRAASLTSGTSKHRYRISDHGRINRLIIGWDLILEHAVSQHGGESVSDNQLPCSTGSGSTFTAGSAHLAFSL